MKREGPQHTSQDARELRQSASDLARDIKALEGIEGAAQLAGERQAEATRLQEQARELEEPARLEVLAVWEDCIVKQTKRGEKKYGRWARRLPGKGGKLRKVSTRSHAGS